jgi:hypothetical protein
LLKRVFERSAMIHHGDQQFSSSDASVHGISSSTTRTRR